MISIKDLEKAKVLKVLFNNSKVQGLNAQLGLHPDDLTDSQARRILCQLTHTTTGEIDIDYLLRKVMKVNLTSDVEFDPAMYDRDNGEGAAIRAVDTLREKGEK